MDNKDKEQPKAKPSDKTEKRPEPPPAGPHAKPELTNPDATPGSGMLPAEDASDDPNAGPSG